MTRPRVLLADDHVLLLEAFKTLLEPRYDVVGAVTDGRQVLSAVAELRPDVVVLDIAMPRLNGLDAGRQLRKESPKLKLVFLTVNEDPDIAAEAMAFGASGYLLKNSAASELFEAIRCAVDGKSYVTPLIAKGMVDSLRRPQRRESSSKLTPRQREVLQLLAEGHSMKEIGALLSITPRTVAHHKYGMMEDLGITTSAGLIQFAIREGLVSP